MIPKPNELRVVDSEPFGTPQLALLVESPEEAARDLAKAYVSPDGKSRGLKALAHRLRPSWPEDRAQRWFLDCTNLERPEKFEGADWLELLRIGHEIGVHVLSAYFATESGYEWRAFDPAEARKRARKARRAALLAELARLEDDE